MNVYVIILSEMQSFNCDVLKDMPLWDICDDRIFMGDNYFFTKEKLGEQLFKVDESGKVTLIYIQFGVRYYIDIEDEDNDGILRVSDVLRGIYDYFHRVIKIDDEYYNNLAKYIKENPDHCEILDCYMEQIQEGGRLTIYETLFTEFDTACMDGIVCHNGKFFLETKEEYKLNYYFPPKY